MIQLIHYKAVLIVTIGNVFSFIIQQHRQAARRIAHAFGQRIISHTAIFRSVHRTIQVRKSRSIQDGWRTILKYQHRITLNGSHDNISVRLRSFIILTGYRWIIVSSVPYVAFGDKDIILVIQTNVVGRRQCRSSDVSSYRRLVSVRRSLSYNGSHARLRLVDKLPSGLSFIFCSVGHCSGNKKIHFFLVRQSRRNIQVDFVTIWTHQARLVLYPIRIFEINFQIGSVWSEVAAFDDHRGSDPTGIRIKSGHLNRLIRIEYCTSYILTIRTWSQIDKYGGKKCQKNSSFLHCFS